MNVIQLPPDTENCYKHYTQGYKAVANDGLGRLYRQNLIY